MVWWLYTPQWNPFLAGVQDSEANKPHVDAAMAHISKHSSQASCMWSPSNGFYHFSGNWANVTGQLARDCQDEQWLDYWQEDLKTLFEQSISDLFSAHPEDRTDSVIIEGDIMHGDGSWVTLELSLVPCGLGNEHKLTILVADVTEQRQALLEVEEHKRQLETLAHCRSSFLSNMSHELRTPLNAIMGFAQMLESKTIQDEETATEYLQYIRASGKDLLTKISDLIELANIDAGNETLHESVMSLRAMVTAAIEMQSHKAFCKDITLRQEHSRPNLVIRGDRARLLHTLSHLLNEAIDRAAPNGIITINCYATPKNGVQISVHERDTSLSPQRTENIQRSLTQDNSYYQTDIEDVSIGLAVCKEIAELHGGHLFVESINGNGTTTTISLPPNRIVSLSAQVRTKDKQFS